MTSLMPRLTQAGLAAILSADTQGIAAKITHVALGDYGYTPAVDATGAATALALRNERERVEIAESTKTGAVLQLAFTADSAAEYFVREFAFLLEDGTPLAIWSDPDKAVAYKSALVPLVLALDLSLAALPADALVVDGSAPPLSLLMTGEIASIAASLAARQLADLQFEDRLRRLEHNAA